MLFLQIASKLVNVIVDGNLSYNFSQLPLLRELLETVAGRPIDMPTRYKIMCTLEKDFETVKTDPKDRIAKQKYVCVTADVWSSRAQSYLGVTVHFLNESHARESYVLGFKQLKGRQTYDVLARALDAIFQDYAIDPKKITHIVTDGGSSFCKMFKQYGDSIDVTVVTEGGDAEEHSEETESLAEVNQVENDEEVEQPFQGVITDDHGEQFVNEVLTLEQPNGQNSEADVDDEIHYFEDNRPNEGISHQIKLPPQRRCVSHLLNLLSKDFEKNLEGNAKSAYEKLFDALRPIWFIIRKSSRAKEICKEVFGITLKYPTETRWNSTFDCISQLNEPAIQRKLNSFIEAIKLELKSTTASLLAPLTNDNFVVMAQYVKVFHPVAIALDILQGEFHCSQGSVLPVLISMKVHITQLEGNNNIIRDFKSLMLNLIEKRFGSYFEYKEQNKDFILSAITQPSIKDTFIVSTETKYSPKTY